MIKYCMAYVSQTIFPAIEMIMIVIVLFINLDNETKVLNAPLVFGLLVDIGIIL